jgi:hypothetical protein
MSAPSKAAITSNATMISSPIHIIRSITFHLPFDLLPRMSFASQFKYEQNKVVTLSNRPQPECGLLHRR